jgi:hypothetical protein
MLVKNTNMGEEYADFIQCNWQIYALHFEMFSLKNARSIVWLFRNNWIELKYGKNHYEKPWCYLANTGILPTNI